MPGFRRYGNYGRRYRRYYNRRGWTRSWRRPTLNRRITSGTRTFSCTVPVEGISAMIVPATSYYTNVYAVSPWQHNPSSQYSPYYECNLMTSDLYKTYAKLYDEMKIDWVSYEIAILDVIGQGGTFSACRLWTTIDRKTTTDDFVNPLNSYQIRTSSGAQGTMLTNNSRTVTRRYVAATDLQERTCWHDCSIAETTTGQPPALLIYDKAFVKAAENILFFSPSLWYCLELSSAPAAQTMINVSIKVKYGVTFRNPKFGLTTQASARSAENERKVEIVEDEKKEVDIVKPVVTGMAKEALNRLSANVSDSCADYVNGDNDVEEDLEFLISKIGVDGVREYFPEGKCLSYDNYLKERGVMDDDPTEVVKK